nr:unnamed protein product [Digitaria exilis]CAB3503872.1 unnamed protein product [Digitaria exilis]
MQGSKHRVVTDLPKDLLVEIFSRVPYKSLCRCRCVSRSWHALCSDPDVVKKSPQTLSGFILHAGDKQGRHRLLNLPGSGRPLLDSLTPFQCHYYSSIRLVHSCNGLLLWRCCKHPASSYEVDYVVCNPATKQWTALPPDEMELRGIMWQAYRLCFDPAISSHFRVFMFLPGYICGGPFKGVAIFSSDFEPNDHQLFRCGT